jgi:hypothetical protein
LRSEPVGFLAAATLLSMLAGGGAATAAPQASVTPARLEVEALPACSTRDELVARIVARSTRIRFVNEGTGVPELTARIEVGAKGVVVAELRVVEPDGRKFQRRIQAPSCAAATDALALVVAITLDPSANMGDVAAGGAGSDGRSAASAAPPPPRAPDAPPAEPPPLPRSDGETLPGEAVGPGTYRLTAGVFVEAVAGPAPVAMPGPAAEIQAAYDRTSILSPALALTFAHLWSGPLREGGGTARFTLDWIGLDACPIRLTVLRFEARACAAAAVGRLAAEGSNTYEPRFVARAFATAGGTARLALLLPWRLEVRGRLGAGATLWRDAFQFTPEVFHRTASVTLVGDVGIGVRFP